MTLIQVRNVPEDVHRKLKERAAREGRSLSDLVLEELLRVAERPTRAEILERLASLPPADYEGETAAESVRAERDAR